MHLSTFAPALLVALIAPSASVLGQQSVSRDFKELPGSPILASTTQFNPALTNQGGTTNSAGTFDVSQLATSTSLVFQPASQTSSFVVSSPNVANPQATGGNDGGNGGSSSNQVTPEGNAVASTVVQTVIPTETSDAGSGAGSTATDALGALASNLGVNPNSGDANAAASSFSSSICAALAVVGATMLGVAVVA